jgi:hypothetical protein
VCDVVAHNAIEGLVRGAGKGERWSGSLTPIMDGSGWEELDGGWIRPCPSSRVVGVTSSGCRGIEGDVKAAGSEGHEQGQTT